VFCQRTGFGGTIQRADDRTLEEDRKSAFMGKLYEMSNAPASKKKQGHTWTDEEVRLDFVVASLLPACSRN